MVTIRCEVRHESAILSSKTAASRLVQAATEREIVMKDSQVGESQAHEVAEGAVTILAFSAPVSSQGFLNCAPCVLDLSKFCLISV